MIRACCVWLQNGMQADRLGDKGFAVLAFHEGKRRCFYVQARPFDRQFVKDFDKVEALRRVSVAVAIDMPLKHCPSCGTKLSILIEEQTEAFDQFAASVAHLFKT